MTNPYFGGAGPRRAGCIHCARCCTGCPHNAKNTTLTNYLYLAEQAGGQVHPLTTVTSVRALDGGGYHGTPEQVAKRLNEYQQAGANHVAILAGGHVRQCSGTAGVGRTRWTTWLVALR